MLLEVASSGKKFPYMKLLIESMDKDSPVTQDDVERKIRHVFMVVAKYVKDPKVLAAIASELGLMENNEDAEDPDDPS